MPTYNCAEYLDRSISSVLRQTYANWELIIIDDGSTDESESICNYYCSLDSRVKYYSQPINLGVSKARNLGIEKANGEYICFLDADDLYHHEFLSTLHNKIEGYDISYSGFIYKNGNSISESIDFTYTGNILKHYIELVSEQKHPLCICSLLVRKDLIITRNLFFSSSKNGEDTEFIIKLLESANANYSKKRLFTYLQGRIGSETTSNKIENQILSVLDSYKRVYEYLDDKNKFLAAKLIEAEITYHVKNLTKKRLFRNRKILLSILRWAFKNKKIIQG